MALRLAELDPETNWRYVCTPTGDELPDVLLHWANLECLLGKPIEKVTHKLGLNELIAEFDALPSWRMRWCTRILKIETAIAWYARNAPCVAYVGLRADEPKRKGGIFGNSVNQRYPMKEWGWGLTDVHKYLLSKNVTIPRRTDCARCPYQKLSDWWYLWNEHPEYYASAESQELKIGNTFRSPQRDTWPADLKGLRLRFEQGDIPNAVQLNDDLFDQVESCRACSL